VARRRRNRKYRRGRFLPLLRALFSLLVCVAVAVAMTIFFKIEEITVSGNARYTAEQVVEATGIQLGQNMFVLNKYEISDQMTRDLPYIDTVQIRRRLPSTLAVEITETQATVAVASGSSWWLMDADGKLLEKTEDNGGLLSVWHVSPLLPTPGSLLALPEDGTISAQRLLELLDIIEQKGMSKVIRAVNCSDPDILILRYSDRFRVEIPYGADLSKKLDMLVEIVARLEENETGTIRMTREDGTCHFIPGELPS